MYVKDNNIFIEIDKLYKQNENLKFHLKEQEDKLNNLKKEKNDVMKISRELAQKNELNLNDINYYRNEINIQTKKYEDDTNKLNSNIEENFNLEKELTEEQNTNRNLIEKLKTTENMIEITQNKLFEANKTISQIKNIINPSKDNYEQNQNEIIDINDKVIKEVSQSNEICKKNNVLNASIEEKDKKIDELNKENNTFKNEIKDSKEKINDYNILLKNYKKLIKILTEQNEKMSKQFDEIIETDDEMIKEIEKMGYLEEIVEKNTKIIRDLS
jgi:chromosome segregation ATPase